MRTHRMVLSILLIVTGMLLYCSQQRIRRPPVADVDNVVDVYYGVSVDDPYRYMENLEDPEVRRWIKGQAEYAAEALGKIPGRAELMERLRELDAGKPFITFSIIRFGDGTLFYQKRAVGENIPKLYVRYAGSTEERLLVDPEQMTSEDGQHFSMGFYSPSPDGRYVAYGLAKGGSEETVLHILDIQSGEDLP